MKPCPKTLQDLSPYIDGELEPMEELALRRHLDTCSSCRRQVRTLTALKETVTRTAAVYPLPHTLRVMLQTLPKPARRGLSTLTSFFKAGWLLVFALMILTAAIRVARQRDSPRSPPTLYRHSAVAQLLPAAPEVEALRRALAKGWDARGSPHGPEVLS